MYMYTCSYNEFFVFHLNVEFLIHVLTIFNIINNEISAQVLTLVFDVDA